MSDSTVTGLVHELPRSGEVDERTKSEVMSCHEPLVERSR